MGAPAARAIDPAAATVDRTTGLTGPPSAAMDRAQDRLRDRLGSRALLQPDPTAGTPRIVARLDGFLTPPSDRAPESIALDYVREHAAAFGLDSGDLSTLDLTARRRGTDGTVHVAWQQQVGGVPNVDGGLEAAVDADGRLINVRGGPLPDPQAAAPTPRISPEAAYEAAVPGTASAPPAGAGRGDERRTPFLHGGEASLVLYRDGDTDRLGWRVLVAAGSDAFYDAIVDARTGRLQRRVNRTHSAEQINHFNVSPRAPGDGTSLSTAPPEWFSAGERRLIGPYVHAVSDLDDTIRLVRDGSSYQLSEQPVLADEVAPTSPIGSPNRSWNYAALLGPAGGFFCSFCSWEDPDGAAPDERTQNREFSTAQLFWYVNTFRDHLAQAPINFTGAGEFKDGDAVIAQSLDGATTGPDNKHTSNANMTVLPDGFPGLMQMYLFKETNPGRYDGAMDAGIVYHEYTHGLSERLVTDAQGFGALVGPQPAALAEGISDFYAMDYLVETQEDAMGDTTAQGELRFGRWLHPNDNLKGANAIRTEGIDCAAPPAHDPSACPGMALTAGTGGYTYDDFGKILGAPEVHADGEIWGQTLWSLRTALTTAHTSDGLSRAREYITEGLRLAPDNPTFLDMRNAIVQAVATRHGGQDWILVWNVFKARGMGWSASTDGPTDISPIPAFDGPPPPPGSGPRGSISGTIQDELGAPVGGAKVAVSGHDGGSALGATDISDISDEAGSFLIPDVVAGTYADLYFRKPGFQELTTSVAVAENQTTNRSIKPLLRDYASTSSGGSINSWTGSNFGADGCGPGQAIDDDKGTVWSTEAANPKDLVIDLGRALDINQVRIDPRAGCGDPPGSSLARYELAASDGSGGPFETIAGGTISPETLDARGYAALPLAGDLTGRRLLRLRAVEPRDPGDPDVEYMDVSELEVTGTPSPVTPPPTPSATPTPSPTPTPTPQPVVATALRVSKLSASRKGTFKIKVRFGSTAPAGTAQLRVLAGKKRLAVGSLAVHRLRTATKTLKLNSTGRRMIKPGKSRKVTLELRLPGGQKVKKTVTLARKKR